MNPMRPFTETSAKPVASRLCLDLFTSKPGISGHRPDATTVVNGVLQKSLTVKKAREDGFTLTELLVVIVIVAILGLELLPALAGTKPNSQAFQCLENLRQLTLGWQMYAQDYNGKLTPNGEVGEQPSTWPNPVYEQGGQYAQWCPGDVINTVTVMYQTNYIQIGLIYPYVKTINVYKCPADYSTMGFGPLTFPRVRSYSMNCWLSPFPGKDWASITATPKCRIFYKDSDMVLPGPTMTFVFIEENVNSLDDGYFACTPALPGGWINVPSTRHGNAAGISFADGHAEIKRWSDSVVLSQNAPNFKWSGGWLFSSDPNSGDNAWLEQRESYVLGQ